MFKCIASGVWIMLFIEFAYLSLELQEDVGKVKETSILHFDLSCFHNRKHRQFNSSPHRARCPIQGPAMDSGALIDVAKYVGSLGFHVWEKMHKIIKYSESPSSHTFHFILKTPCMTIFLEIFSSSDSGPQHSGTVAHPVR